MYADTWFRRYIMSNVISARADQIELFDAQLPGDKSINLSVLRNRADQLMEMVKEYLTDLNDTEIIIQKS